ncbi:MAG: phosphate propanoyltransferase [Treponema sp.]|jgi:putative phosphotransacetylase|nr:phosphate propanoyltransferase [Treponema sp.]
MGMDREQIARLVLAELAQRNMRVIPARIPVGVSVRHVHLSRLDINRLFGDGYALGELKPISQPGQFAAQEQVTLIGPHGRRLERVRIIGPEREETQIELARTDAIFLGLSPPVRMSGDLQNTPGITLAVNDRSLYAARGVIIAARHIHMKAADAAVWGLKDGGIISIHVEGEKGGLMENVHVVMNSRCALDFHIDTDDANAFGISEGQWIEFTGGKWRVKL